MMSTSMPGSPTGSECPVCFEYPMDEPKEAECGHVLCSNCWQRIGWTRLRPFKCPLCRRNVTEWLDANFEMPSGEEVSASTDEWFRAHIAPLVQRQLVDYRHVEDQRAQELATRMEEYARSIQAQVDEIARNTNELTLAMNTSNGPDVDELRARVEDSIDGLRAITATHEQE